MQVKDVQQWKLWLILGLVTNAKLSVMWMARKKILILTLNVLLINTTFPS